MKKKPLYDYRPVPGVFTFQIDVPHKDYGECDYFMPKEMVAWLIAQGMNYGYAGSRSSGDGYTNGITNKESIYSVRNAKEEDGLAFQLLFPFTKVHIFQQYDYQ
jgi:hypothetical protein